MRLQAPRLHRRLSNIAQESSLDSNMRDTHTILLQLDPMVGKPLYEHPSVCEYVGYNLYWLINHSVYLT